MSDTLTISPAKAAFRASTKLHLNWNAQLSERETEISKQVALGLTQNEVAEIFSRSPHTITNTLRNAFRKTGARNIAEFAAWIWCKEFHVTLIISEGRRKIMALAFIALFLALEFIPRVPAIRTIRQGRRVEIRATRGRKAEDYDYLPNI